MPTETESPANIPFLLALLLCDCVITDSETGKRSVIGIFDKIWSPAEPIFQRVALFARLTDMEGEYRFSIRVVHVLGDSENMVAQGQVFVSPPQDRLQPVDIALNLPPTTFPQFGRYEFQLFANEIFLGRATLNVAKTEVSSS